MVLHWWRERGQHWKIKATANGIGALATGTTLVIVAVSKFSEGAWITILVIPLLVVLFIVIRRHYRLVASQLTLRGLPPSLKSYPPLRVVVPISGVHRGMLDAVLFAKSISKDVTAVYIEMQDGHGNDVCKEWQRWFPDIPLIMLPSPYRSMVGPLLDFLDQTDQQHNDGRQAAGGAARICACQMVAGAASQPDFMADQGRIALQPA